MTDTIATTPNRPHRLYQALAITRDRGRPFHHRCRPVCLHRETRILRLHEHDGTTHENAVHVPNAKYAGASNYAVTGYVRCSAFSSSWWPTLSG